MKNPSLQETPVQGQENDQKVTDREATERAEREEQENLKRETQPQR